jgi:xanthine dehydrogenase accessory factor
MRELAATLAAWRAEGATVGRAVVVRAFASTPRHEGAVMLATADGRIAGSVSGGCVEGAVFEEIQAAMRSGLSRVIRFGISDEQAWDVGLACGGVIDVLIQPHVPEAVERAAVERPGRQGAGTAIVTPLPDGSPGPTPGPHAPGPGSKPSAAMVVHDDGRVEGSTGEAASAEELARLAVEAIDKGASRTVEVGGRSFFIETYAARPRLVVVGAGQVAIPLVALARLLGYETVVVDGRAAFATRERFPDADEIAVAWPDEAAGRIGLGPADAVAVLSHDPRFDDPAVLAAFARGCRYVGVIGSRRSQSERRARLAAAGATPEQLAGLRGPIGLDLGGRAPAETALAIMAEIVATRFGGSGRPLVERR